MTQALKAVKALIKESEEEYETPEYIKTGNDVHRFMEATAADEKIRDTMFENLSSDGQWLAKQCRDGRDEAIKKAFPQPDNPIGDSYEQRLWSKCGRYSGQYDYGSHGITSVLLIDYKTGRIPVPEAHLNYQLRALAVLAKQNMSPVPDKIFTAIVQPRVSPSLTICEYTAADLDRAELELNVLMDMIDEKDAPLKAGDWCTFCPARSICPVAAKSMAMDVAKIASDLDIEKFAETLSPLELSSIAAMAKRGRSLFDAVEDRISEMLKADPNSVPGWHLKSQTPAKRIASAQKAWECLSGIMTAEQFAGCCTVSFSALEPKFHEIASESTNSEGMGLSKAEHRKALRDLLAPALVPHERAPILEKDIA